MPDGFSVSLILVIVLALAFDFINGFHDTANSIATSVSTRVLTPRAAIIMAAGLNFLGAMIVKNVAKTISSGIVQSGVSVPEYVIIAALVSAIIWNLVTWFFGIPSSSSHALIGSLVGAAIAYTMTFDAINWKGVLDKVVIPLVVSPLLGFGIGYLFMTLIYEACRKMTQMSVNKWFSKLQIVSAAFMAYSHGGNDAQKSMGIITLALFGAGVIKTTDVPWEVVLACAIAMALGTSFGGWRIIKTIGVNMIKLQPVQGFAAETSAAVIIETASALGAPVSTTHIISSAIMGVGASKRFSAVKWTVARSIVTAWFVTIPVNMAIGALICFGIKLLFFR